MVRFAKLIEENQLSDSRQLLTEGSEFGAFEAQLKRFERIESEVGDPGRMEGAAGSSYVEVPLQLTGQGESGEPLTLTGLVTLHRTNDVPGSTELQRQWHIYRVELQPRP